MGQDWKTAQAATHPFQRRRDVLAQEQARNTAVAQTTTPEPPRQIAPFIHDPLRRCVCGARPRYGFEEHVARCALAKMAAAEPPPVTAVEVVTAIGATAPSDVTPEKIAAAIEVVKTAVPAGVCPKCGRTFKTTHVPHFHAKNCKG